jgi:hypothetical protein
VPDSEAELRVAAAVCSILGCGYVCRDLGGSQIRDFDLLFDEGRVEPLEVTEASIASIRHTQGRLRETNRPAPSLTRWWSLDVPSRQRAADGTEEAYDIRRLLTDAEPLLEALEAEGRTSFDIPSERYSIPPGSPLYVPYNGLLRLGVTLGLSSPAPLGETGRITLGMRYSSTGYGESLADLVLKEANDSGNRRKLSEPPGAPRRHLAVLLDPTVGQAYHALRYGQAGPTPSALPSPITTVWVLADRYVAHATPPGSWSIDEIRDSSVFHEPGLWEAES